MKPLFLSPILLLLGLVYSVNAQETESLERYNEDWQSASLLFYNSASHEVNLIRSEGVLDNRMKNYSAALDAIHHPHATAEEIEAAREKLDVIASVEWSDDMTLAARYYLIRIVQKFQTIPDVKLANRLYLELFKEHPGHYFGQMALHMHSFISLYHEVENGGAGKILVELESLGEEMSIPDPKRAFHRVMGEAYDYYELSGEKAYQHMKKAYELTFPLQSAKIDALLALGEKAVENGEKGYAIQIYSDFLDAQKRNPRKNEVEERLRRLGAAVSTP